MKERHLNPAEWARREGITSTRAYALLDQQRIPGVHVVVLPNGKQQRFIPNSITKSAVTLKRGRPNKTKEM